MDKIKIEYVGQKGIWHIYKVNGKKLEFNYLPTPAQIMRIFKEYEKEEKQK